MFLVNSVAYSDLPRIRVPVNVSPPVHSSLVNSSTQLRLEHVLSGQIAVLRTERDSVLASLESCENCQSPLRPVSLSGVPEPMRDLSGRIWFVARSNSEPEVAETYSSIGRAREACRAYHPDAHIPSYDDFLGFMESFDRSCEHSPHPKNAALFKLASQSWIESDGKFFSAISFRPDLITSYTARYAAICVIDP